MNTLKVMTAKKLPNIPDNFSVLNVHLPLDMLDPIGKIEEPVFYEMVRNSIISNGLYHPLLVYPISIYDWQDELTRDKDQVPPPMDSNILRYRIQCGCNRFYVLQDLGYDAVECLVVEDLEQAYRMCQIMRADKKWQRNDNFRYIPERLGV